MADADAGSPGRPDEGAGWTDETRYRSATALDQHAGAAPAGDGPGTQQGDDLAAQLSAERERVADLRRAVEALRAEFAETVEAERADARAQLEAVQAEFAETLEAERAQARAQLDAVRAEFAETVEAERADAHTRLEAVQAEFAETLEAERAQARAQLDAVRAEFATELQAERDAAAAARADHDRAQQTAEEERSAREADLSAARSRSAQLELDAQDLRTQLEEAGAQLQAAAQRVTELEAAHAESAERHEADARAIDGLRRELSDTHDRLAAAERRAAELDAALTDEREQARHDREADAAARDQLQHDLAAAQADLADAAARADELDQRLAVTTGRAETAEAHAGDLARRLEDAERTLTEQGTALRDERLGFAHALAEAGREVTAAQERATRAEAALAQPATPDPSTRPADRPRPRPRPSG